MTRRCTQPPLGPAAKAATRHRAVLPRLVTDRLVLRAPELADLPLWTEICGGPDGALVGGPMSDREAWEAFCTYTAGWALHGHGLWSVETRGAADLVGFVMLGLEWEDRDPELGWMMDPAARGKGYGSEAATAARDHGLGLLGPGVCVSYVAAGNTPSARLAASIGATRDTAAEATLGDGTQIWRHGARGAAA